MASLTTYIPYDMVNVRVWFGVLQSYSSNHITYASGQHTGTHLGNFTFDGYGNVYGRLFGYEQRNYGELEVIFSRFDVDAHRGLYLINSGDAQGFFAYAFSGNDSMNGSLFADTLKGYSGSDTLKGNGSNDRLYGDGNSDRLFGGTGDDILSGGTGSDRLVGGTGGDVLRGGAGADVFAFQMLSDSRGVSGRDDIADFDRGSDKIDLSSIDAKANMAGNQAFNFIGSAAFSGHQGQLRYAGSHVYGDVNGDKVYDFAIDFGNAPATLNSADFIL